MPMSGLFRSIEYHLFCNSEPIVDKSSVRIGPIFRIRNVKNL